MVFAIRENNNNALLTEVLTQVLLPNVYSRDQKQLRSVSVTWFLLTSKLCVVQRPFLKYNIHSLPENLFVSSRQVAVSYFKIWSILSNC